MTLSDNIKKLSPQRNSTKAKDIPSLVHEQLIHFCIEPDSIFGQSIAQVAKKLYECSDDVNTLWALTQKSIHELDHSDRIACFNAKKFLSFQLAKILDDLQNPFRKSYQSLNYSLSTTAAKGSYPVFDNVTALFSATPVIARTATYIYACAEWIEDAFKGKELLLEIYSRLLNPTSLSLANHIVDLEAGPYAHKYLAWNFNSGMAAIDTLLAHVLGRNDILITSRNIYGGAHQLINDWYAKPSNLNIDVEFFDGETVEDFTKCLNRVKKENPSLFNKSGQSQQQIYVYLESPSNPHGYVLDVPGICKAAHREGLRVLLDSTVATPFLYQPLQRKDSEERPDFVIHSYSKDLSGMGSVIAGAVIGRNEDMFIPKGDKNWEQTMFWNVYYVKGAFLNADAAFEVLQGTRTLEMRMLSKCINTEILAHFLDSHPSIKVNANCLDHNINSSLRQNLLFLGLPAPLFTIDMDTISRTLFQRFFDCLAPTFSHMVSLGQTNTIISCPGLTTHSELNLKQQEEADIKPHTIRFAVGCENPKDLINHIMASAKLAIDPDVKDFSNQFMSQEKVNHLIRKTYARTHQDFIEARIIEGNKD